MAKRSVQSYIEEIPCWDDGARLAGLPRSGRQWLVWSLAITSLVGAVITWMDRIETTGIDMDLI